MTLWESYMIPLSKLQDLHTLESPSVYYYILLSPNSLDSREKSVALPNIVSRSSSWSIWILLTIRHGLDSCRQRAQR